MNRLRSFSQGKAKDRENSVPSTPSKEDILSTIDGFGNKIEGMHNFKDIMQNWTHC